MVKERIPFTLLILLCNHGCKSTSYAFSELNELQVAAYTDDLPSEAIYHGPECRRKYSNLAEIQETTHAADVEMIVATAKHKWITYTISL